MKINRIYDDKRQSAADLLEENNRQRFIVRRRAERRRDMDHIAKHLDLPTRAERGAPEKGGSRAPGPSSRRSMAGRFVDALGWALLFATLAVVIWLGRNSFWG